MRARVRSCVGVVRGPVPGSRAPRVRATVRMLGMTVAVVAALSACAGRGSSGAAQVAAASVPGAAAPGGSAAAVPGDAKAASPDPSPSVDKNDKSSGGSSQSSSTAAGKPVKVSVNARRAVQVQDKTLVVRTVPSGSAKVLARLPAKTTLGSPRVFLVRKVRTGWVQVDLPTRPNGVSGWVASSAVRVETMHDEIGVDLKTRRMTVVLDGVRVVDSPVAIGSKANPTPKGTFYVTDRVRPEKADGAYGTFALGLSAHSPTLTEFGNGDGQVGIHGTNVPSSIGKAVSHGCVRVPDSVATVLARVPLGTPVVVR